jgi:hypothetical protein
MRVNTVLLAATPGRAARTRMRVLVNTGSRRAECTRQPDNNGRASP